MPLRMTWPQAAATIAALGLASCSTPYGLKVASADFESAPMPGTITFTGPKLYRREALINERREEGQYLKKLLDDSGTAQFQPDIVRQLEVIKVLSASLGLNFDPAAGLQNRRADERAAIQQDIDTLRLEMQLDQLRRDASPLSEKLAAQTEPSGNAAGAGEAPATSGPVDVSAPSVADLQKAIVDLRTLLTRDLGDKATALTPLSAGFGNPIDSFHDRAAYRELLNGARNAASLDELHDRDGAALIRLNMTATVFPPRRSYRASFGRLQMQVRAPDQADPDYAKAIAGLYRDWLHHVTPGMSQPTAVTNGLPTGFTLSTLGAALSARTDLLDVVAFEFGSARSSECRGLSAPEDDAARSGCMIIHLATPRVSVDGFTRASSASLQQLANKFADRSIDYTAVFARLAQSNVAPRLVGPGCARGEELAAQPFDAVNIPPGELNVGRVVTLAFALDKLSQVMPLAESEARAVAALHGLPAYFLPFNGIPPGAVVAARQVVNQVQAAARSMGCAPAFIASDVPPSFTAALDYGGAPSIYQVGPKQQVQIVSSQARAAEEIALAASLAGQAPSQGIGASAAMNFGRRAVGRVDALERVPLVVGYADSAEAGSFGWMMGPRAGLDPARSELLLEQGLRPQDLSVDLIVPGWWPYLTLATESTWAPQWSGRGGKVGQSAAARPVRVGLSPTPADFEQITSHVLGASTIKQPLLETLEPSAIPACATGLAIQLRGAQLWRTTEVVIGGRLYGADTIQVLPGLEGILVKGVAAEAPVIGPSRQGHPRSLAVTALTPYGPAPGTLGLGAKEQQDCGAPAAKPSEK